MHDTQDRSSLNPADWQRLSEYLDKAFDLEPAERERWLADLATTDPNAADTVRRLLAKQESLTADGFLESSPGVMLNYLTQAHAGTA